MTATPEPADDKPKCGAKAKQHDGTCKLPAGYGTDHVGFGRCKFHGGSAPAGRQQGERLRIEHEARELFGRIAPDIEPVDNPLAAYAQFAGRVMAWMQHMDNLLDGLQSPRYEGATAEQIRGEVQLYERAMDRANQVLGAYARLGIDDRLARVTERQGEQIAQILTAVLADLGLPDETQQEARRGVVRHLRSLRGSS